MVLQNTCKYTTFTIKLLCFQMITRTVIVRASVRVWFL
jgi:hypothetical protein